MGPQWPKHPYVIFTYLSIINISVFVVSIIIYVALLKNAANLTMNIIPLVIPISAFAFGFYNISTHLRDIKAHNKKIKDI